MEDYKKISDEQAEKLQKQVAALKKRISVLKKCNDNLTKSNQDLNRKLRTQERIHDKLIGILFIDTYQGLYEISVLLKWVEEIVYKNEKLMEEQKMMQPFKSIETSRVKLLLYEN